MTLDQFFDYVDDIKENYEYADIPSRWCDFFVGLANHIRNCNDCRQVFENSSIIRLARNIYDLFLIFATIEFFDMRRKDK